jgi:hypothetical protein
LHARKEGGGARAAQLIFLGVGAGGRLGGRVPLAETVTRTYVFDLGGMPNWILILGGTLAAVLAIYVVMKLLKWTLWLLFFAVLAGGLAWAFWELIK